MQKNQRTIKKEVVIYGSGLHTGLETKVKFKPAQPFQGITFVRSDLDNRPTISAYGKNVISTNRGTTLQENGAIVKTTEHLLAAIAGLEIDNIFIEIDNEEIPILDGSSDPFLKILQSAGIKEENINKQYFNPKNKIEFYFEETDSRYILEPADEFSASVNVDYNTEILGKSSAKINSISEFKKELSSSRTFCFLHEISELADNNLIKGGDLNNAIIFVENKIKDIEVKKLQNLFNKKDLKIKEKRILNDLKLRYKNEPARHKLLDVIGDLTLLGIPIKGKLKVSKPGHKANTEFVKKLLSIMKNTTPQYNVNETPVKNINEIMEILPHRPPFLFLDKIIELSNNHVVGVKNVTMNEDFFIGHFPKSPVMPGVLQIEAMAQAGGILILNTVPDPKNYLTYFMKIDNVKFKQKVIPGDTLIFRLDLASPIRRGICHMTGNAYVGDKIVMQAELMAKIEKIK
ncbi:MAG: UDP-3-O-[3-hydroxymyristoyl] N-acetylglucosamine deacetylase [Flavobacteriales bacterium]|nr:UDP-3-O-[3-hydroxymyristoyl] N-acetylglucosamine deacetylase [Flavobacteriales bacterium]